MTLVSGIKNLAGQNVWVSAGLLDSGLLLLRLSDVSNLIRLIHRLIPALSYNFVENTFSTVGLAALLASFGTFALWIQAANKKRQVMRSNAFRRGAESMNWNYSESPTSDLRKYVDAFLTARVLGVPAQLRCTGQNTANFLSREIEDDLLIIFDCYLTAVNPQADSTHFYETVYLVVSDKLNLPYFQTQPESIVGDNFLGDYFKQQAGLNDAAFPERPVFSQKYAVDVRPTDAPQIFTAPVFDFYEQHDLYRTVGDGKMLGLLTRQIEPFDQNQITAQLQTLQGIYQLLKNP